MPGRDRRAHGDGDGCPHDHRGTSRFPSPRAAGRCPPGWGTPTADRCTPRRQGRRCDKHPTPMAARTEQGQSRTGRMVQAGCPSSGVHRRYSHRPGTLRGVRRRCHTEFAGTERAARRWRICGSRPAATRLTSLAVRRDVEISEATALAEMIATATAFLNAAAENRQIAAVQLTAAAPVVKAARREPLVLTEGAHQAVTPNQAL